MKNRCLRERVGFALEGWRAGWRREASFRAQVVGAGVALVALFLLWPAPIWWGLVTLVIGLILALELFNAALEALIDLLHPSYHPEIKAMKDMSAGAVLLLSVASLVIGGVMVVDRAPAKLAQWGIIR